MANIDGKQHITGKFSVCSLGNIPAQGALHLGIDIGSVSCKLALLGDDQSILYLNYRRTAGRPLETAQAMLKGLFDVIPADRVATMVGTGSAGRMLCEILDIDFVNELICQSVAAGHLYPQVRTLIEMGGQDSKIISLSSAGESCHVVAGDMLDFTMNTNCAAGTGSFLDQQASRLGVDIEKEFGELALRSELPPRVAGRCSVFAKSDMIHLQQQATPVHDIVAGLCLGLARNLKNTLCQGKELVLPVAFCGGVAGNVGVVRALEDVFALGRGGLIVPAEHAVTGAIGAVLVQMRLGPGKGSLQESRVLLARLDKHVKQHRIVGHRIKRLAQPVNPIPASKVHSELIEQARQSGNKIPAYLGIDVGSISTNVVVMSEDRKVLSKAYLMTASRPLEAVRKGLELVNDVRDVVEIRGAATTGSGRYLTGDFVGADLVINEITAQATGAIIVEPQVDTIFEIGGQDSKYISLENGVVVDFEMNHACAAGTGSFLEEQAERLGLNIKEEFAREAFSCDSPIRLGERCTVFMESDLLSFQQQGAQNADLTAGLCYSIVTNYLNRVVGHRKVGQRICFQGGTAFNRAVVAAFEAVLGKDIIVPDHHEVTGAIGAAELARRHMRHLSGQQSGRTIASTFKGFDLSQLEYKIRTFECNHCANNCEIKEVIIAGGAPLFYGSRCDRYNVKKQQDKTNKLPDLFRQRQQMLEHYARMQPQDSSGLADATGVKQPRRKIGIPMCLSNYQLLPLWGTFFSELGFDVITSGRSSKAVINSGVEAVLAQPCFPIKVAHGHVLELINRDVDYIWLPSIVSMSADYAENKHNQLCPYVQAIPYQVRAALQAKGIDTTDEKNHMLDLPVRFQDGIKHLRRSLWPLAGKFGLGKAKINQALDAAQAAQARFEEDCRRLGRQTLASLEPGQRVCVLISRPYNGCDPGISLDMPRKLRDLNVLAIPMDFLDLPGANVTEPQLQTDMYWKYGQRILRAAHVIRDDPRLHAIYLSNFSCGPDSFIISLFKELMTITQPDGTEQRKPALVIEIDEHSADAGVITRLEAFLESLKAVETHAAHSLTGQLNNQPVGTAPAVQSAASPWRGVWGDCANRVIYIPWMGDASYALAAAFRHCGQDAQVLPLADEETLRLGRKFTTGKECLPCIITTGDMLKKAMDPTAKAEQLAFFMPSGSGPCRFGQYNCLQRLVLKQAGLPNTIPIVAPSQSSEFYESFRRFRKDPTRLAFNGIAAMDLLLKVLYKIRPYELRPGQADEVYEGNRRRVEKAIEAGADMPALVRCMDKCAWDFKQVPVDRSEPKPLVAVVGEIYVRSHVFSNDNIVRQLEKLGAEVFLAGFDEWLYYTNLTRKLMARRERNAKLFLQNVIRDLVQHKTENKLARPLERFFGPVAEGDIAEVIDYANPYIHESFEGEAVISVGKMIEMFHHGAAGAVNVMPFTCMPSTIVSAVTRRLAMDLGGMPIINISYDGQQDPTLQTRLEAFLHQVSGFRSRNVQAPAHAR